MDNNTMAPEQLTPGTSVQVQETPAPTLSEVLNDTAEPAQPQTATQQEQQPQQAPKYLEGKRLEWEAKHRAEMDELRGQLSTMQEYFITNEVDKLVSSGKIADREMAEVYVRASKGIPAAQTTQPTQPATTPQRDAQGRFVATPKPSEVPAEIQQRANALTTQADTIQALTGVDVYGVMQSNPEYAQKVYAGEWDMKDVLNAHNAGGTARTAAPSLIRTPNGSMGGKTGFRNMSDDQFAKINAMLADGKSIDVR